MGIKTRGNCAISDLTIRPVARVCRHKSRYNISYVSPSMSFNSSSRVRCTYKASFTPRRLRAAASPCDFLSRFGLTPGLWTVYTRINVHTRTYPRTVADALARGYIHLRRWSPVLHTPRVHYARYIERAFLLDTITRPAPRLIDTRRDRATVSICVHRYTRDTKAQSRNISLFENSIR